MGKDVRFPHDHAAFLDRCHQAGQIRPTPLLLEYAPEDYNCLHRDLYGEHVFPMQIAILLDQPGEDFEGGEFVMTEQRPRMQTRAMVLPLKKGDAAIFAVNSRPMKGVARRLSGEAESRRQQTLLGQAAHRRRDLPRCGLDPSHSTACSIFPRHAVRKVSVTRRWADAAGISSDAGTTGRRVAQNFSARPGGQNQTAPRTCQRAVSHRSARSRSAILTLHQPASAPVATERCHW